MIGIVFLYSCVTIYSNNLFIFILIGMEDQEDIASDIHSDSELGVDEDNNEDIASDDKFISNNSNFTKERSIIHLRNVPNMITKNDLIQLISPYGRISEYLGVKNNQIFVQMENSEDAQALVSYFEGDNFLEYK